MPKSRHRRKDKTRPRGQTQGTAKYHGAGLNDLAVYLDAVVERGRLITKRCQQLYGPPSYRDPNGDNELIYTDEQFEGAELQLEQEGIIVAGGDLT